MINLEKVDVAKNLLGQKVFPDTSFVNNKQHYPKETW